MGRDRRGPLGGPEGGPAEGRWVGPVEPDGGPLAGRKVDRRGGRSVGRGWTGGGPEGGPEGGPLGVGSVALTGRMEATSPGGWNSRGVDAGSSAGSELAGVKGQEAGRRRAPVPRPRRCRRFQRREGVGSLVAQGACASSSTASPRMTLVAPPSMFSPT